MTVTLKHPGGSRRIVVSAEMSDMYLSQGWEALPEKKDRARTRKPTQPAAPAAKAEKETP